MPRPPRPQLAGARYHLTSRGNRRQLVFRSNGDRLLFLDLLAQASRRYGWWVYAYSLLDNHYHLLLETPQANISAGMQWLNGRYAQWTNGLHGLDGHLFQGRFHSTLVERDEHLLELARYLALNPVRAGLCGSELLWPWGSYPATVGLAPAPAFLEAHRLLRFFDEDPHRARTALHLFVAAGRSAV